MTLRILATGKMQQCTSDDLGPSQSTVILHNICKARNIPLLDDDGDDDGDDDNDDDSDDDCDGNDNSTINPTLQSGSSRESIRDCFTNLHFG